MTENFEGFEQFETRVQLGGKLITIRTFRVFGAWASFNDFLIPKEMLTHCFPNKFFPTAAESVKAEFDELTDLIEHHKRSQYFLKTEQAEIYRSWRRRLESPSPTEAGGTAMWN